MGRMFNPPHPGRIIAEQLAYAGISPEDFARRTGIESGLLDGILRKQVPVTEKVASCIAGEIPGPDACMWLRMQADYDAWQSEQSTPVSG